MDDVLVLVVSDDPLARGGLAALLAGQPGLRVAGATGGGSELRASLSAVSAHVAVCDPGPEGVTEAHALADLVEAGVPVLAILADELQASEALAAGARGALPRDVGGERLSAALRAVASGLVVLDPAMVEATVRPRSASAAPLVEPLTPREAQVLQLLAEGLSNRVIAERLKITERTAKFHVNSILGKLGAQSRTEAIVQAARLGLVSL